MHVLIILSMLFLAACEPSPKQARRELIALDYSYSRNSMAEAIRKEDSAALELFLRAGIEPDAVSAGYSMLEHASAIFSARWSMRNTLLWTKPAKRQTSRSHLYRRNLITRYWGMSPTMSWVNCSNCCLKFRVTRW